MPLAFDRRTFIARIAAVIAGTAVFGQAKRSEASIQSIEPYLGEIMLWSGTFAPRGWAFCNGQLLAIAQNQALFALLGTTYGGNGLTTFALPDLRDRVPIHFGQGPGLSNRVLGEKAGVASHVLSIPELPSHGHGIQASTSFGTSITPTGMYPARNQGVIPQYTATGDVAMSSQAIGAGGASQPHMNLQPSLGIHFVIALQGVFPSP